MDESRHKTIPTSWMGRVVLALRSMAIHGSGGARGSRKGNGGGDKAGTKTLGQMYELSAY